MDLWKEIDIDLCYNDSDSDHVIRNVFLDSVSSSTPVKQPALLDDDHSSSESLMIDLHDIAREGEGAEAKGGQDAIPDLVMDENFEKMIDQILDEIDLGNTDTVVTDPAQESPQDSLPSPLAESTPKKNTSVLKRFSSTNTVVPVKDKNDNLVTCHATPEPTYQILNNPDHGYSSKSVGLSGSALRKYRPSRKQRQSKLVSVLKPARIPQVSIGNYFSNFSPDVTTVRKLDRYL